MSTNVKPPDNQAAYRRLRDTINAMYPSGQFVAIDDEQIIGDAPGFAEMVKLLQSQGRNPTATLIVQAGMDYPKSVVILCAGNTR